MADRLLKFEESAPFKRLSRFVPKYFPLGKYDGRKLFFTTGMTENRGPIAFYGRVSKREQARDSSAAERQIWQLEKEAERMGCEQPYLIYFDVQSGRRDDRPNFMKVLDLIKYKEISKLVIPRADRITRNIEMNAKLIKLFTETGVELYEIYRGGVVDFKNPSDWEYFTHAGLSSEAEARRMSKRIRDGQEYARYKGKPNAKVPFGYSKNETKTQYILDNSLWSGGNPNSIDGFTTAMAAREMIELFIGTKDKPGVKQLRTIVPLIEQLYGKKWTSSGFGRWLRNEIHVGGTPYKRKGQGLYAGASVKHGTHEETLMTQDEYDEIWQVLERNKRLRGNNTRVRINPLSGLIFCGHCGQRMTISHSPKGYDYVYCNNRKKRGRVPGYVGGVRLIDAEDMAINALVQRSEEIAQSIASVKSTQKAIDPELIRLREQLAEITRYIKNFGDAGHVQSEVIRIEHEIQRREGTPDRSGIPPSQMQILIEVGSDPASWHQISPERKEIYYHWFIRRIVCMGTPEGWIVDRVELKI